MELTKEEATVLLQLVDRVQLSGKEAGTVAFIQSKLQKIASPKETVTSNEEAPKKK